MALTVGELVAYLRLNRSEYRRGLAEGKQEARAAGTDISRSLDVKIDRTGIERYARRIRDLRTLYSASLRPVRDYSQQVAGLAVKAGAASAALGAGVGLLGVTGSLALSIAQVAGALPLLTTALAGVTAVTLTAKFGLSGVADAIDQKIGHAFDKVSPKARAFVDTFGRLVPRLVELRAAVQDDLFEGWARSLKPLADRYLPLASRYGQAIAAALGAAGQNVAGGLLDPRTAAALSTVLAATVDILRRLGPTLRGVVPLFAQLAAAGAPILESLAARVTRGIERWKRELREALASGAAQDAMRNGVNNAVELLGILADVAATLYRVGQAAQTAFGANLLGGLHDITTAIREWVSSAEGQRVLVGVFRAFAPVLAGVLDLAHLLGPELLSLLPIVRDLALTFIAGLRPVIPVLGDVVRGIGEALIAILPAVSKVAVALGGFLADALETLAPVIPPLAEAIASLLSPTGLLGAILAALAPVLAPLARGLAQVVALLGGGLAAAVNTLAPMLPPLVDAIVALAVQVAGSLAGALQAVAPMLPVIVSQFTDLLIALTPLIPALAPLIPVLVRLAVDVLTPLLALLVDLAPRVVDLAEALVQLAAVVAGVLGPLVGFAISVFHAFSAWVGRGGFPDLILTVATWIVGLPGRIAGVPGRMIRAGLAIIGGLYSGLSGRWGDVARFFARIGPRILAAVGDLGGLLVDAGRRVIAGFIAGLKAAIPGVGDVLGSLTRMIPGWKGPEERDRRLLTPAGRYVIRGLVAGIEAEVPSLRAALADVTRMIPGDAGALTLQANREASSMLPSGRPAPAVIEVRSGGSRLDDLLVEVLRRSVRTRGGNVQLILGSS